MDMLKLRNVHKYYNRKRQNEIHVLNDITLSLPSSGLVVLLGPSGSGKTTLLNVIGGLDKIHHGSILFDGHELSKYRSNIWDQIRNRDVGYVFQNYNLLPHLTVYENISFTLNMIGIYDQDEIDRRIDYILERIGMIHYRKRRASQLSGGQQQRVAIARALAKNPKIIIADEPTGNLDSKNTQEIMEIIKAISKFKLVVLVTHEEKLAKYYGDRIIRMKDGIIISDEKNIPNGKLNMKHETDIYLGDLSKQNFGEFLSVFSDDEEMRNVKVQLIIKNKTMYVDIKTNDIKNIQLLGPDSEVRLQEGTYQNEAIDIDEQLFDLDSVIKEKPPAKQKHSVIRIRDSLNIAWLRMKKTNLFGKAIYGAFGLVAALVALAISMGNRFVTFEKEEYLEDSMNLVLVEKGNFTYDDFITLEELESIEHVRLLNQAPISINLPPIFQSYSQTSSFSYPTSLLTSAQSSQLILGAFPTKQTDFIIDMQVADKLVDSYDMQYLGISTYEALLELPYSIEINGVNGSYQIDLTLTGIIDSGSPVIFLDEQIMYMAAYKIGIYEYFQDDLNLEVGDLPTNNQMLIYHVDTLPNPITDLKQLVFSTEFTVSGSYTMIGENAPISLIKLEDAKRAYFNEQYTRPGQEINVIASDVETAISDLAQKGYQVTSYHDIQLENYREDRVREGIGTITFILVVLGISALSYFLVIRSSLLARIYEVSVYRALGVSRWDIHKMFLVETLLVSTLTSVVGYSLMILLLWRLQVLLEDFTTIVRITPLSTLTGVLLIYLVNALSGLIPVTNLLRKTPAEILSKYDF
jgi:ABC-type lipoprotein export system ATPase subunit